MLTSSPFTILKQKFESFESPYYDKYNVLFSLTHRYYLVITCYILKISVNNGHYP